MQRDTFLRRWLLPEPVGQAKLRAVVAGITIEGQTFDAAIAGFAKQVGVRIEVSPGALALQRDRGKLINLSLREASVDQVLQTIVELASMQGTVTVVGENDRIAIVTEAEANATVVVRLYDVEKLLPPPGIAPPPTPPSSGRGLFSQGGMAVVQTAVTTRTLATEDLERLIAMEIEALSPNSTGNTSQYAAATVIGGKMIVVVPAPNETRVSEILYALKTPSK